MKFSRVSQVEVLKKYCLSPAFTADNLETLYEIDDEYKELFLENGGKSLTMVPSLNDSSKWADSIVEIIDV